ncbi:MAG: phospholipase D-like domain-containing protein [bacterium]
MPLVDWLLTAAERGNPATVIDAAHPDGQAWSEGNLVRPLVHGVPYFRELAAAVERMVADDLLLFVDWRGDPDERMTGEPGSEVASVLSQAAERGVRVHGLIWRSHWDKLAFSAQENRHLDEDINRAGGSCILDMRVRSGGSHHQKFVVLRHPGRPEHDVAFVGGIDLCHSRRDDADHDGDPQRQPMAAVYGPRPPWHDVQLRITGPVVADVETVFRERWNDPQPPSRSPLRRIADRERKDDAPASALPAQLPPPAAVGEHTVQLLRTYPRRRGGYPFAPHGERSVARGYLKALRQARTLIYVEDQYLWSKDVGQRIGAALTEHPGLHMIAVVPHHPDQDGRFSLPPNIVGRQAALAAIRSAAPDRVALYGLENHAGTPVYVHAKVCVIDDQWASVGSDNFNRRSWTHDSELTVAVWDSERTGGGARRYPRDLRLTLAREHLDQPDADLDAASMFGAFAESAAALQGWHDGGRTGTRPPGRLRPLQEEPPSRVTRAWAGPLYRTVYDPDARPLLRRLRGTY